MKLRKYYVSLWPNNQPPIFIGTLRAKDKKNATKEAKKRLDLTINQQKDLQVTTKDITANW
jgi:hypothetical protein